MGLGICAMHYSGMSAIQILPIITYEPWLLAASAIIAIGASFAALWLFVRQRVQRTLQAHLTHSRCRGHHGARHQRHALHRHGRIEVRARIRSASLRRAPNGTWLAMTIALLSLGALALTLILLFYDAHLSQTLASSRGRAAASQRATPAPGDA